MMMMIILPFLLFLLFLITPPFLKSVTVCAPLFNSNPFPHFFFFILFIFQRHICMIVLSLPACVESNMKTEMILLITHSQCDTFSSVCCASFAAPIFSILTTVTTTTTTVLCCLCFLQKEPVSVNYDNDVDNVMPLSSPLVLILFWRTLHGRWYTFFGVVVSNWTHQLLPSVDGQMSEKERVAKCRKVLVVGERERYDEWSPFFWVARAKAL